VSDAKRKTWHDRKCRHGNFATTRCQYDFIHCDKPGCWDDVLRAVGFVRRTPLIDAAPDLLAALQEIIADASCSAYAAQVAEAAIAKAVKLRKVRVNG